jgi:hypothetical protein
MGRDGDQLKSLSSGARPSLRRPRNVRLLDRRGDEQIQVCDGERETERLAERTGEAESALLACLTKHNITLSNSIISWSGVLVIAVANNICRVASGS